MCSKLVAYYRVSTKLQQKSGLGLAAQADAVAAYALSTCKEIIASYTEQETGKRNDRPSLNKALARAKREGAQLVIAKLDRLSRNVAFIATLMDSGVPFICCDNPHANQLTIHILAAMAQYEREQIALRTKLSLAEAKKKRGVLLGSSRPGHWNENNQKARLAALVQGRKTSATNRKKQAREQWRDVFPLLRQLFRQNLSLLEIGKALLERKIKPLRGEKWHATTVKRLLLLAKII